MATVTFASFVPEIAPHLIGCPTAVMERYIAKVAIDLCERASIWRVRLTDIALTSGDYEYPLTSPVADTEITSLLSASVLVDSTTRKPIEIYTDDYVRECFPRWPDTDNPGEPRGVFRYDTANVQVYPVPDDNVTYALQLWALLRPSATATGWEGTLQNEFRRAIFHGVLYELMTMPERTWYNEKMAVYHGKQWTNLVAAARARANKGYSRQSIFVQPRPWA